MKPLKLTIVLVVVVALASSTGAAESPYPPSSLTKSITWHWDTHTTAAPGSDLWPVTWASDGNIYTAWGDGGGFGGTNSDGRVTIGFARIEGTPESYVGTNVNGGKDSESPASFPHKGKSGGILSVDGTLYARLNLQDGKWPNVDFALAWSEDLGATWTKVSWVFPKGAGNFKPSRFLNFGRDYAGVPAHLAGFVYFYGFKQDTDSGSDKSTYMGRVPQDKTKDRSAYEFFKGLDANGKPIWTSDVKEIQPVFTDPNGACLGGVVYNPGIKRYILTSYHTGPGQLGIFDAPEPWGPWTTVAYYDSWGNMGIAGSGLNCDFPQKWMGTDGLTMWCVFSVYGDGAKKGINAHDKFNLVKATLALRSYEDFEETNRNSNRIRVYKENPRYWQYKGKPVLLLGGSKDDNLFQIPDLKGHLDLLASVGGNYIRNTMSDRVIQGYEIQAFKKLPDGKYDLNQWNDEYWDRFETMLKLTGERDIIVQIEVWDRFDYTDYGRFKTWKPNPYNPANNINYTSAESGLEATYPKHHPGADKQPFFHTIPAMDDNKVLRRYQEAFVDKMLSYSLPCGNVLYCMNNETSTAPIWGQYWMKYIKDKAAKAGVDVYLTDMFDVGWELDKGEKFLLSFDRPDIYTFLDISQNTSNKNTFKKHWQNILFVRDRINKNPRPINNTKNYGSSEWPPNSNYYKRVWRRWTTESAVQRYVLNVIGGCASTRFHRNPIGGIGLTTPAQDCIKALRKLETVVKMWELTPRNDLLTDYQDSKVFLSANPGRTYTVFFLEGGSASLNLAGCKGDFRLKWINALTGRWGGENKIVGGKRVTISAPDSGSWIAAIIRL